MTTDELKALLAERGPIFVVSREDVVELIALREREARLVEALRFYADPQIYKPHPYGLGFDRRDVSFRAKAALAEIEKEAGE